MLRHPCILGDPQKRGARSEVVPNKGEQNQKWLPHPCFLSGPKEDRNAMPPVHSQRSRKKQGKTKSGPQTKGNKIRCGYNTLTFSKAQRRAEILCHPYILGDSKQRGGKSKAVPDNWKQNQKWLRHPCHLSGPIGGGNATPHLHSRGSPTKGEQKQKWSPTKGKQIWLPSPCLLMSPKEGQNATPALNSRRSQTKGSKTKTGPRQRTIKSGVATSPLRSWGPKGGQNRYFTLAFSGILNKGEQNQNWSPT